MTETLTIQNFAGIELLEIEIKPITVLIGPQASGKSICAKLIFYFRDFHRYVIDSIFRNRELEEIILIYRQVFEEYFPRHSWNCGNFEITYRNEKDYIKIECLDTEGIRDEESQIPDLSYGQFYKENFERVYAEYLTYKAGREKVDSLEDLLNLNPEPASLDYLDVQFEGKIPVSQVFIPASRSFFSILQDNIFSLPSANQNIEPFMKRFGAFYENMKASTHLFYSVQSLMNASFRNNNDAFEAALRELIGKILSGRYLQEDNVDFIVQRDNRKVPLTKASSGQQETLPLVLVLVFLIASKSRRNPKRSATYIEEPEAHIFPSAQKKIVELIAMAFNYRESQSEFFITTHSPYILTAINNLLQAGELYSKATDRPDIIANLTKIVPKFRALDNKQIAAYSLSDGKCTSILDVETGLIDASLIDEVSDQIAEEFDNVLALLSKEFYAKAS